MASPPELPQLLAQSIASGHVVDWILGLMALEAAALLAWRLRFEQGLRALDILLVLTPGACLLLALRAALTGAPWTGIVLALAASLPLHLFDLARRWRAASS